MTTVNTDIDTITADSDEVILENGSSVQVERLKTRQLMRFLRILTQGAGDLLSTGFSEDMDAETFTGALLGAVVFSIPNAEDETIDFVKSMVSPSGLIERPRSKADKQQNDDLYAAVDEALDNPEIEDLVTIIEHIIRNEGPHIAALGKRLALLLNTVTNSTESAQNKSQSSSKKN